MSTRKDQEAVIARLAKALGEITQVRNAWPEWSDADLLEECVQTAQKALEAPSQPSAEGAKP